MKNYISFDLVTRNIYTITNKSKLADFKDFPNIAEIFVEVELIPNHRDFIVNATLDGLSIKPADTVKAEQDAILVQRAENVTDFERIDPVIKYHIEYLYEQINILRSAATLPALSVEEHRNAIKQVVIVDHARVFPK